VLNEDQESLEKRVELLRQVCQTVSKKILGCITSQGQQPVDTEKRMKKLPLSGLSTSLIDCSAQLGQQTHSGQVFMLCGDAEGKVALDTVQLEVSIEDKVLKPITDLLDVDIPSIQKLRKQLNVRTLDMDAAKTRYAAAVKQAQQAGGLQSKVDAAKEEVEDAMTKMEQTRDQLATEMYTFVAKESDLSHCMLELAQAQAVYHRNAVEVFEQLIPLLQESIEFSVPKPLFGLALENHLDRSGRRVASVLEDCVNALLDYGLDEEGLFRIAGAASKVKKLRAALNAENASVTLCPEEFDAHVVATVLKQYLRELPQPLMTFQLHDEWTQAMCLPVEQRPPVLREIIDKMPKAYRDNLQYLIKFLARLSENSDINKMSASNIGLVIGPNLLWPLNDAGANMMTAGLQNASSIVELLVTNVTYYFPDVDEADSPALSDYSSRSSSHHSIGLANSTTLPATMTDNFQQPASAPVLLPTTGPQYHFYPVCSGPTDSVLPPADSGPQQMTQHFQPVTVQANEQFCDKVVTQSAGNSPSVAKRASKKTRAAPPPPPPADPASSTGDGLPQLTGHMTSDPSVLPPQSPISPRLSRPREPPPDRPFLPSEKPPPLPDKIAIEKPPHTLEKPSCVSPSSGIPSKSVMSGVCSSSTMEFRGDQPPRLYPVLPVNPEEHLSATPGTSVSDISTEKHHRRQLSDTGSLGRPLRPTPPPPPSSVPRKIDSPRGERR
jgi:hypothetical protein